jgi:uncharacterized protein involved in response to NO
MRRPLQAYRLFFPAAALYALAAVPLWALEYAGLLPVLRGSGWASWHGHEMVFGYALAVIGGYLLTKLSPRALLAVFALWLLGRVSYLGLPFPPAVEASIAISFPACLFAFAGMPFLRAAKTWRNAMFAGVLAALVLAALAYESGALGALVAGEARGVGLGIDVVTLLMFAMGGRVIAAATSGALRLKGVHLHGVAQPRLEAAGAAAIVAMAALDFWGRAPNLAAVAALAGAAAVALRLFKWRMWRAMDAPELGSLHLGYAWLAVGLAAKASSLALGIPPPFDALHGVMVGALGMLSLAMMARVSLQRSQRPIAYPPAVTLSIAMISGAAVCRLLAAVPALRLPMIATASLFWVSAFALFAAFLFRLNPVPVRREP